MSIRLMSWVLDHSTATGNDRLVLLAIADEADDDGTNAYPSIERIARRARVSKSTAIRSVGRLEAAGHLIVERPEVQGRGRHNTYRVVAEKGVTSTEPEVGNGVSLTPIEAPTPGKKVRNGVTAMTPDPKTQVLTTPPTPPNRSAVTRIKPDDPTFVEFWNAYPKKADKGHARKVFRRVVVDGIPPDDLIAGAKRYANDPRRKPQFTKNAATWLNGECWEDEAPPSGPIYEAPAVRYE